MVLTKEYFTSQSASSDPPLQTELTSDEAYVLRYAGSYVAQTRLRKYEKRSGEVSSQYVQCLGDISVEGEGNDVLSYTRRWLIEDFSP